VAPAGESWKDTVCVVVTVIVTATDWRLNPAASATTL